MKDIKTELDELINLITYHEAAHIAGEPVTDEIRELLVEMLEVTKKALFFRYDKHYETKKPLINPQDAGYRIRQIIYYLNSKETLYFKGELLTQPTRIRMKEELEKQLPLCMRLGRREE
jgi:hypothetical protein